MTSVISTSTWRIRTRFRNTVTAVILAMMATVAVMILPSAPAAASPNECGPWYTDQDIADTYGASCRATFLVDPGVGNVISRQQLLAAAGFYQSQGFARQWLWYPR